MQSSARIKSYNKIHIVDNQKKIKTYFLMKNQMILKQRKQFLNQKQFNDVWFLPQLKTKSQQIPNRIPTNNDTITNIIKNDLTCLG